MFEQFTDNVFISTGLSAAVSFTDNPGDEVGRVQKVNTLNGSVEIKFWGEKNLLPYEREALIKANNIIPELLRTKRDIIMGQGIYPFRERFADGKRNVDEIEMPTEIADWMTQSNFHDYLMTATANLAVHFNVFTEFVRDKGKRIFSIEAKQCRHVRAQKHDNNGVIRNYYWCGKWNRPRDKDAVIETIPVYDPTINQPKFMLHTGDELLYDDYYYMPTWWGGKTWIQLANKIPLFHISNLNNGYAIRWHIEVPKDYFYDYTSQQLTPDQQKSAKTKESEARQAFLDKINDFLSGASNAGRAVFTEYEISKSLGKEFPGIKIQALNADMKDEALLKLFDKSNEANISGQGVHPSLAAIQSAGKLSSGSEILNAFNMFVAIKAPTPRKILLKPLELVQKINGWDPTIKFGFKDIELATLDMNPSGTQPAPAQ